MRKIKDFLNRKIFSRPAIGGILLVASFSFTLTTLLFSLFTRQILQDKGISDAQIEKLCMVFYIAAAVMLLGGIFFLGRNIFARLKDAPKEHQEGIRECKSSDRETYLRKLFLEENQQEEKVKKNLMDFGIDQAIVHGNRVLLFTIDNRKFFILRFQECIEEKEKEVESILEETLRKLYGKIILVKIEKEWAACIPAEKAADDLQGMQEMIASVNQNLLEKLNLTVSVGVSSQGQSVNDISSRYAEAAQLLSYRFLMSNTKLLTADATKEYSTAKLNYPHSTEKKLISQLHAGNHEETVKAYESFVNQVRFCSVEDVRLSFELLLDAILQSFDEGTAELSDVLDRADKFRYWMNEAETLEDINHLFLGWIWELISKVQESSLNKYKLLVEQVKAYVSENYGKITFCMNDVAQHVGMSAAYLGRIFRQMNDMTFSDYLTKYRLDSACDLLINTDKTITEISGLVGFTNCSYFYIVFKKHMNCTPNQYRQQNKPGEQIWDDGMEAEE